MPKTISQLDRHAELGVPTDNSSSSVANDNAPLRDEEHTTLKANLLVSKPANDNKRPWPPYLLDRSARRREAGLVFEYKQMREAIAQLDSGGTGLLVPDSLRPYHITCNEFYYGVCTPRASESPHIHFRGWEAYLVLEGEAEMLVKWHEALGWERRVLLPFDTCLIAPGVCHWLRWASEDGYCVVFKAPTIPGIGKPPNGKQTCLNCHLYKNGCVLPDGFSPE